MASRSVEDISIELNEVKDEIKQVKQYIANATSGEERLQHTIRLNNLAVDKKKLEEYCMFLSVLPRSVLLSLTRVVCSGSCLLLWSGSFVFGVQWNVRDKTLQVRMLRLAWEWMKPRRLRV